MPKAKKALEIHSSLKRTSKTLRGTVPGSFIRASQLSDIISQRGRVGHRIKALEAENDNRGSAPITL